MTANENLDQSKQAEIKPRPPFICPSCTATCGVTVRVLQSQPDPDGRVGCGSCGLRFTPSLQADAPVVIY